MVRPNRVVERRINLNGVEEFREIGRFVKTLPPPRRVNITGPVRVRPAGWSHANHALRFRFSVWRHNWNATVGAQQVYPEPRRAVPVFNEAPTLRSTAAPGSVLLRKHARNRAAVLHVLRKLRGQSRAEQPRLSTHSELSCRAECSRPRNVLRRDCRPDDSLVCFEHDAVQKATPRRPPLLQELLQVHP